MNLDSSAYLAIGAWCAWYSAAAMVLLYGVYRMLTDDEVRQLALQVADMVIYAKQSKLFLETLNAKLNAQPVAGTGNPPPKSAIEQAFNRRKDDDQTKGELK